MYSYLRWYRGERGEKIIPGSAVTYRFPNMGIGTVVDGGKVKTVLSLTVIAARKLGLPEYVVEEACRNVHVLWKSEEDSPRGVAGASILAACRTFGIPVDLRRLLEVLGLKKWRYVNRYYVKIYRPVDVSHLAKIHASRALGKLGFPGALREVCVKIEEVKRGLKKPITPAHLAAISIILVLKGKVTIKDVARTLGVHPYGRWWKKLRGIEVS